MVFKFLDKNGLGFPQKHKKHEHPKQFLSKFAFVKNIEKPNDF